jgi:alkanesulfonate monooxygenase SsuD/methylene tetrahydromethanopterin reductase-like flavin-dependent oxidoreductase (luciferase family)
LLDEAADAERAGFDAVFVPERHARTECMFPSPIPLMAAIAARTSRVKIGTDIMMPPLYNPVHLAQSTALIDVLSRGRLILGVGVGYHPDYFAHFGIPIKQREGRFERSRDRDHGECGHAQLSEALLAGLEHRGADFLVEAGAHDPDPQPLPGQVGLDLRHPASRVLAALST